MIAIVNEKPSQARNFAAALGAKRTRDGFYEGDLSGRPFRIIALRGHIYELDEPGNQVSADRAGELRRWDVKTLPWDSSEFAWKLKLRDKCSQVLAQLRRGLKGCDEVYIATDDDPTGEGTGLFAEPFVVLGLTRSFKFSRIFFQDESPASIKAAIARPVPVPDLIHEGDFMQAWFRNRWDFLSMQWTRIATKVGDGHSVLRQGRLKSAMVRLVGDAIDAHESYVKTVSYQRRFRDENDVIYTSEKQEVYERAEQVPGGFHPSSVTEDKRTRKTTRPPAFLDLAALAARLSGKGISAKQVLDTYQRMYEANIVSYPRTEDRKVTLEQFRELLPLTADIARLVGVDASLLTHTEPRDSHVGGKCAHGANRPGTTVPTSLDILDQYGPGAADIYVAVAKSWLACLAEDYVYERVSGHVTDYPDFVGATNVEVSRGWKDVTGSEAGSKAGLGKQAEPIVFEIIPPRPAWPTMKWLMGQLENRNVGTGATRTSVYSDTLAGKYPLMSEKRGRISLTDFGNMSYHLLPGTHIGDLTLTESVMEEMAQVKAGKANAEELLARVADYVRDDIEVMEQNGVEMRNKLGVTMKDYGTAEKFKGTWNGRQVSVKREQRGHRLTDEECATLLDGGSVTCSFTSKAGKPYTAEGKLADMEYNGYAFVGVDWEYVNDSDDVERFHGTWNGREVAVKRIQRGYRLNDDEVSTLLAGGTVTCSFTSKAGKPYTMEGKLADMDYNGHQYVGVDWQFEGSRDVPNSWCTHKFTDEEKELLRAGERVALTDCVSKRTGKTFSCEVSYGETDRGNKGIVPHFE